MGDSHVKLGRWCSGAERDERCVGALMAGKEALTRIKLGGAGVKGTGVGRPAGIDRPAEGARQSRVWQMGLLGEKEILVRREKQKHSTQNKQGIESVAQHTPGLGRHCRSSTHQMLAPSRELSSAAHAAGQAAAGTGLPLRHAPAPAARPIRSSSSRAASTAASMALRLPLPLPLVPGAEGVAHMADSSTVTGEAMRGRPCGTSAAASAAALAGREGPASAAAGLGAADGRRMAGAPKRAAMSSASSSM